MLPGAETALRDRGRRSFRSDRSPGRSTLPHDTHTPLLAVPSPTTTSPGCSPRAGRSPHPTRPSGTPSEPSSCRRSRIPRCSTRSRPLMRRRAGSSGPRKRRDARWCWPLAGSSAGSSARSPTDSRVTKIASDPWRGNRRIAERDDQERARWRARASKPRPKQQCRPRLGNRFHHEDAGARGQVQSRHIELETDPDRARHGRTSQARDRRSEILERGQITTQKGTDGYGRGVGVETYPVSARREATYSREFPSWWLSVPPSPLPSVTPPCADPPVTVVGAPIAPVTVETVIVKLCTPTRRFVTPNTFEITGSGSKIPFHCVTSQRPVELTLLGRALKS